MEEEKIKIQQVLVLGLGAAVAGFALLILNMGGIQTAIPPTPQQPKEPGIEAVFAIAGLLAVAYLVLRQRK